MYLRFTSCSLSTQHMCQFKILPHVGPFVCPTGPTADSFLRNTCVSTVSGTAGTALSKAGPQNLHTYLSLESHWPRAGLWWWLRPRLFLLLHLFLSISVPRRETHRTPDTPAVSSPTCLAAPPCSQWSLLRLSPRPPGLLLALPQCPLPSLTDSVILCPREET